ncbi:MAG TPA: hypothetical protein PLX06_06115 [Fimbriimonadaceae bacterium]|nr:hypothetical protein [Fimbriimonadaceae bacterium]
MADIPRVAPVVSAATVTPQVHRVGQPGDRPQQHRKEHENAPEDVLDLHEEEPEAEKPALGFSVSDEGETHLDIAV